MLSREPKLFYDEAEIQSVERWNYWSGAISGALVVIFFVSLAYVLR